MFAIFNNTSQQFVEFNRHDVPVHTKNPRIYNDLNEAKDITKSINDKSHEMFNNAEAVLDEYTALLEERYKSIERGEKKLNKLNNQDKFTRKELKSISNLEKRLDVLRDDAKQYRSVIRNAKSVINKFGEYIKSDISVVKLSTSRV